VHLPYPTGQVIAASLVYWDDGVEFMNHGRRYCIRACVRQAVQI
jgi:hypothetical protein